MANDFQHKPDSGTLFDAKEKKSERSPDMQGSCLVNGKEMRISGWWKTGKKGDFLSLAFSEPQARNESRQTNEYQAPVSKQATSYDGEDAPF